MEIKQLNYELIVVGGGMAGVLAAISAARNGVKTALVQNRPVLGGNASSEVRMNINGADRGGQKKNVKESGIMLELAHRCKAVNPQNSFCVHDAVLWEMVTEQPNITLFLNTHVHKADTVNDKITAVHAIQTSSNKEFILTADYFADTTGDGELAFLSGADYTIGREGKSTYNEDLAPDQADEHTMGNSIMFTTMDMGKKVDFVRPCWAYEITEQQVAGRRINDTGYGYWWIEVGGDDLKIIEDAEEIRDELMRYAYGVFDYIKNSGKYNAENLALDWVCSTPGRRESRRVYGDYMLNQNDVDNAVYFEDAIAYGGWTMDDHSIGGIRRNATAKEEGTIWHEFKNGKQIYTIPYRCIYSRNIKNLWVGGRCASASHMAMTSTRITATCGILGQAIGVAAAIAKQYNTTPRGVGEHIQILQQKLILDDCFIPGIPTKQPTELITNHKPSITASSQQTGYEATNICSDYPRTVGDKSHTWVSQPMNGSPAWLDITFTKTITISNGIIRFDPDFNCLLITTLVKARQQKMPDGMPALLVKDYNIIFYNGENEVKTTHCNNNIVRVNEFCFDTPIQCDKVRITVNATHGDPCARICELQLF